MKTTTQRAIARAIEIMGGQSPLAEAIGCTQPTISHVLLGRRALSARHAMLVEKATSGAVRVEDLAPDLPWHVVRGASGVK